MLRKVRLPGATTANEWLYERPFGLNRVIEIVRGPFVNQLGQGHRPQFLMAGLPAQVGQGNLGQGRQAFGPQKKAPVIAASTSLSCVLVEKV